MNLELRIVVCALCNKNMFNNIKKLFQKLNFITQLIDLDTNEISKMLYLDSI